MLEMESFLSESSTEKKEAESQNCRNDEAHTLRANRKLARAQREEKYQAKQARIQELNNKQESRESWIREHAHCCTQVTLEDVQNMKKSDDNNDNSLSSLLRPYIDLKDGPKQTESSQEEILFIAEGTETVRLLIQQSLSQNALTVKSIFVKPATLFDPPVKLLTDITQVSTSRKRQRDDEGSVVDSPPFHILVASSQEAMSAVAGFQISRGALACGVVPKRDEAWLDSFITTQQRQGTPLRLLAMDGISDTANLGAMVRCAAAFGVAAVVLSNDCCDAWYRRSVRVSMGYIFKVPVVRVKDLASTLRRLNKTFVSYAAVIDSDADLVLEDMKGGDVPRSWCCVMGNEGNGISQSVVLACSHRLRIAMSVGVDSLSVPIATGILLHGLKEREARDIE